MIDIDPKMEKQKSEKFNNLFERTADEVFYDFIGKHSRKILTLISLSLLSVIYGAYHWHQDKQHRENISKDIANIIKKKENGDSYHQDIQKTFHKTKILSYRATLLLLEDLDHMSSEEWFLFLQQVKDLKYFCQYVHTSSHFKRFSFVTELLFLKTLYFLGKKKQMQDMQAFFMAKKLQASILSHYMQYVLVIYTQDNAMLNDMLSSYEYNITNIPKELLIFTQLGVVNE